MSGLVRTLYPLPDLRRTPLSMLRWWEARRLKYNLVVGSAGAVTLTVLTIASFLVPGPGGLPFPEIAMATAAYALVANICYSLGWLTEMAARLIWGRNAPLMGPLLYREGLIFSVGLTLLPILLVGLRMVLEVVLVLAG